MIVELDQKDLIALVKGISPNCSFEHPIVSLYGRHIGGFVDEWEWNYQSLQEAQPEVLWEVYTLCKNSWKRV